ncbi:unnamed protein product [Microthlaspi erraticum]|uniref:Uncharacterized protein n=1 Tax=Microthlaspi erraticum TaxID=1685480 RepID=A0A6D2JGS1_9BRAS|nr:unnamed protein product [Microthlaspi erraticum]
MREEERGNLGRFEVFLDESASICCCSSLLPSPFHVSSQIKEESASGTSRATPSLVSVDTTQVGVDRHKWVSTDTKRVSLDTNRSCTAALSPPRKTSSVQKILPLPPEPPDPPDPWVLSPPPFSAAMNPDLHLPPSATVSLIPEMRSSLSCLTRSDLLCFPFDTAKAHCSKHLLCLLNCVVP